MARAARAGARRALLELRAGNREALALYESLGFGTPRRAPRVLPRAGRGRAGPRPGAGLPGAPNRLELARAACYRPLRGRGAPRAPHDAPPTPTRGSPSDPAGGAECRRNRFRPRASTATKYRQLEVQHHEYESRLGELADKAVLSDEEQVEETTLKKKKLQLKDRMQEIARRQRVSSAHP